MRENFTHGTRLYVDRGKVKWLVKFAMSLHESHGKTSRAEKDNQVTASDISPEVKLENI